MTSMRRRMLVWLLSSVLVGGLAATGVVYFQARQQFDELFDYQLRQVALMLRDRTYSVTQFAEALAGDEAVDSVIQVWGSDGRQIYHSHPNMQLPPPKQVGFDDVATGNGKWRVFVIQQRGLTIEVAQPKALRNDLAFNAAGTTASVTGAFAAGTMYLDAMDGRLAMLTTPRSRPASSLATDENSSACSMMRSAIDNRFSPMKVRHTLRRLRSKSWAPNWLSSAPICIVSADCDTCSADAACVKL